MSDYIDESFPLCVSNTPCVGNNLRMKYRFFPEIYFDFIYLHIILGDETGESSEYHGTLIYKNDGHYVAFIKTKESEKDFYKMVEKVEGLYEKNRLEELSKLDVGRYNGTLTFKEPDY